MDSLYFLNKKVISFNIEATNWCYLKCSACDRTIRKDHVKKRNDLNYKVFEKLINKDLKNVNLKNISFNFCGIYGDNLYHPDIIPIFKLLKNRNANILLETNGSYRSKEFWKELLSVLTQRDTINFSIDGLEDTNKIYRKGSSWKHIIEALEMCAKSDVITSWKFIVFKHNQHQIKDAQNLAKNLGINRFELRYSGRFLKEDPLLPDPEFVGLQQKHREEVEKNFKNNTVNDNIKILPRCLTGKNMGITNEGLVLPCLTFHSTHNEWLEKNKEKLSLHNRNITEIFQDPIWLELKELWESPKDAPYICSKYCGMPKKEAKYYDYDRIKKRDRITFHYK